MKKFKVIALICAALMGFTLLCACNNDSKPDDSDTPPETVDYVPQLKLDMTSSTKKQEVTVRLYVDGDTTHFDPVKNSALTGYTEGDFDESDGYIKARYLAVNTPESTGTIEKWGKSASKFTRSKLESATSIIVESDDGKWNFDSTTSHRLMLWVWYMPKGETEYRNLNLEILQNGYALASSTANNRYGTIMVKALEQAQALKLHVFSPADTVDENFHEGAAVSMTIKELRCHVADYLDQSVRVQGVIVAEFDNSVYIEDFDPETGLYFGFGVYYGFNAPAGLSKIFQIGNCVEVVGKVEYYEAGGTYQIAGVTYDRYHPEREENSSLVSEGNEAAFQELDAATFKSKISVTFEREDKDGNPLEDEVVEINCGEAVLGASASFSHLTVKSTYTTSNGGNNDGAVTITCTAEDGKTEVVVRTEVLTDADGKLVTADVYAGKTISVKGLIEKYNGNYQVKVHRFDYITFEN